MNRQPNNLNIPIDQPRPHALFSAFLCCFSGVGLLLSGATPGSIDEQLSSNFVTIWGLLLSAGGALVLVAVFLPDPIWALLIERIGWVLLGGMCLVYAATILISFGKPAVFPGSIALALGAASWWRVVQISAFVRQMSRAAADIDRRNGT